MFWCELDLHVLRVCGLAVYFGVLLWLLVCLLYFIVYDMFVCGFVFYELFDFV